MATQDSEFAHHVAEFERFMRRDQQAYPIGKIPDDIMEEIANAKYGVGPT